MLAKVLAKAQAKRQETPRDAGFSLVELIVAISIFSIFLTVFIAGVVQLTRATYAASARMESSQEMGIMHQRIDSSVRFAEAINAPGTAPSGRVYVEYFTSSEATSDVRNYCTQLRYDPNEGTIAMRRWSWAASAPAQGPGSTSWQNLATEVLPPDSASPATYPFARTLATPDTPFQRLLIEVRLGVEVWGSETTTQNTFIARNSSPTSITNTGGVVCNGGGGLNRP